MKKTNLGFYGSLIAMMCIVPSVAQSAIRVDNLSRTKAADYQKVAAAQQQPINAAYAQSGADVGPRMTTQQETAAPETESSVSEECTAIYPDGLFENATPTIGLNAGGKETCTAVIEMRAYGAGENGSDLVVARANLAAGDSDICNISNFPESSWLDAAGQVEFPGDREPTVNDVIQVMNQEQKQHAGFKIASMALVGALGGNVTGENDPGKDGLLGISKDKLIHTAIGAAGGAAIGAGSAYSGKVAGDMILSTGVNAAAGAAIGNMISEGNEKLRITGCEIPEKKSSDSSNDETTSYKRIKGCLWGTLVKTKILCLNGKNSDCIKDNKPVADTEIYASAFYNIVTEDTYLCKTEDGGTYSECTAMELYDVKLDAYPGKNLTDVAKEQFAAIHSTPKNAFYLDEKAKTFSSSTSVTDDQKWAKISSAGLPTGTHQPAFIIDVEDKPFGYKQSEFEDFKKNNGLNTKNPEFILYGRNSDGKGFKLTETYKLEDFRPVYNDTDDGQLIDFGNKARLKSTLIGAGTGAAMGAFTAYQGAQNDIQERWVTEVRRYKDSLQKFYCITGKRFLSQYNDPFVIPAPATPETTEQ